MLDSLRRERCILKHPCYSGILLTVIVVHPPSDPPAIEKEAGVVVVNDLSGLAYCYRFYRPTSGLAVLVSNGGRCVLETVGL
jgi:hypothetical protein